MPILVRIAQFTVIVVANKGLRFGTRGGVTWAHSSLLSIRTDKGPDVVTRWFIGNANTIHVDTVNITNPMKSIGTCKLYSSNSSTYFTVLTTGSVKCGWATLTSETSLPQALYWLPLYCLQVDGHCCEESAMLRYATRYQIPSPHCGSMLPYILYWRGIGSHCLSLFARQCFAALLMGKFFGHFRTW